jgi:PQQ-like domain
MMTRSDPVLLEGFGSQRVLLTPVPVAGGVVLVHQDGGVAAFDLSGRERWDVEAARPGRPPVLGAHLVALGRTGLLLDDHEQWSRLAVVDGSRRWGPVHFGSLRYSRRSPDDRWWAYVASDGGVAVAALDAAAGDVAELGRRDAYATVVAAEPDHLLAIEGGDLVRLDIAPDGETDLTETWSRSLRRAPAGGEEAAVDAIEAVELGSLVVVPLVGFGLVAIDHDGGTAWEIELGEYSAPKVTTHDGVLHVLDDRYLSLDAAGRVLQTVDLRQWEGPRLGQVHSPRLHGGRVFGADASGLLFCLDPAQDAITWSFVTRDATPRTCGLALAEGQLWALDLGGSVYGFRLP